MGCHFLLQDLPQPGIKHKPFVSPALVSGFFTTEPPGKLLLLKYQTLKKCMYSYLRNVRYTERLLFLNILCLFNSFLLLWNPEIVIILIKMLKNYSCKWPNVLNFSSSPASNFFFYFHYISTQMNSGLIISIHLLLGISENVWGMLPCYTPDHKL